MIFHLKCGIIINRGFNIERWFSNYMVKLYTDLKYFNGEDGIFYIDSFFNFSVKATMFSQNIWNAIKKYEQAEPVQPIEGNILNGRFGTYLIFQMSSGVKTLILLMLIKEGKIEKPLFISGLGCGDNILDPVLDLVEELEIPFFFRNMNVYDIRDRDFLVNNRKKIKTRLELSNILESL